MDPSSDFEFFDFKDVTDEEIKEIKSILNGPGDNGCVELPWEVAVTDNSFEDTSDNKVTAEDVVGADTDCTKENVNLAQEFIEEPQPAASQLPLPTVDAFVSLPATVSTYPNASYFISRAVPCLRAYPHMGMPFFACPIPGTNDTGPYGQFLPVAPPPVAQEKFPVDNDSSYKRERHLKRSKKKSPPDDCSREQDGPTCTVSSADRPTSVPLVPLPPSTFAVAGATLPLHGYPPGLHALPYTQMAGPQSAAMYYVPVFNHPYGSYLHSPSAPPLVLPVNIRPRVEKCDDHHPQSAGALSSDATLDRASSSDTSGDDSALTDPCRVQSNDTVDFCGGGPRPPDDTKVNAREEEDFSSVSSSSPDCPAVTDDSRCWADLFKKPSPQVNGVDQQQQHRVGSHFKNDITNGKTYSVPVSDTFMEH